jgi:hypothetical protein
MAGREELGEVEVSRGESVEHDLNSLIEKRHDQRTTEERHRSSEEPWKASVERYNCERERQLRAAWCEYHQGQAARHRCVLEALIADHEEKARKLLAAEDRGRGLVRCAAPQ